MNKSIRYVQRILLPQLLLLLTISVAIHNAYYTYIRACVARRCAYFLCALHSLCVVYTYNLRSKLNFFSFPHFRIELSAVSLSLLVVAAAAAAMVVVLRLNLNRRLWRGDILEATLLAFIVQSTACIAQCIYTRKVDASEWMMFSWKRMSFANAIIFAVEPWTRKLLLLLSWINCWFMTFDRWSWKIAHE